MKTNLRTTALLASIFIPWPAVSLAERNNLKPADFQPLTELPWKKEGATMKSILEAIFLEPNIGIRYPVLAAYLRSIPVEELGKAFDRCIELEGTQTPNDLVAFFLFTWASRDPQGCWERTRDLFHVVGIENGWLNYDSWGKRPPITVQDLDAIRHSPFWLEPEALKTFPLGVEASSLPRADRAKFFQDFAKKWIDAFRLWPGLEVGRELRYDSSVASWSNVETAFNMSADQLRSLTPAHVGYEPAAYEIALRRKLIAEPGSAAEMVEMARGVHRSQASKGPWYSWEVPSNELLMLWARTDLAGLIRWAETLDIRKSSEAARVRGFAMTLITPETRGRWLADAKSEDPDGDFTHSLLEQWAGWDLVPALDAALATDDSDTILNVANTAAYGPWVWAWNTTHSGLGVIKDFDVARLQERVRSNAFMNWEVIMEQWGDIDIGEAARYGLDFLLRTDYAPKENLIRLFSGDDEFASDGDMIDRTFCALRAWAVIRPDEMREWIGTLKEAAMRDALTWLLENPWGWGPEE